MIMGIIYFPCLNLTQNVTFNSKIGEQNSSTESSTEIRTVAVNSISQFYATVEGTKIKTLIDTGSSLNSLNQKTFDKNKDVNPHRRNPCMLFRLN